MHQDKEKNLLPQMKEDHFGIFGTFCPFALRVQELEEVTKKVRHL